jgi:hypothetical protein
MTSLVFPRGFQRLWQFSIERIAHAPPNIAAFMAPKSVLTPPELSAAYRIFFQSGFSQPWNEPQSGSGVLCRALVSTVSHKHHLRIQ